MKNPFRHCRYSAHERRLLHMSVETPNPENRVLRPEQRQNVDQLLSQPMFENEQQLGRFLESMLNRLGAALRGTDASGFNARNLTRTQARLNNPNIPLARNDFQQRMNFARAQAAVRAQAGGMPNAPVQRQN